MSVFLNSANSANQVSSDNKNVIAKSIPQSFVGRTWTWIKQNPLNTCIAAGFIGCHLMESAEGAIPTALIMAVAGKILATIGNLSSYATSSNPIKRGVVISSMLAFFTATSVAAQDDAWRSLGQLRASYQPRYAYDREHNECRNWLLNSMMRGPKELIKQNRPLNKVLIPYKLAYAFIAFEKHPLGHFSRTHIDTRETCILTLLNNTRSIIKACFEGNDPENYTVELLPDAYLDIKEGFEGSSNRVVYLAMQDKDCICGFFESVASIDKLGPNAVCLLTTFKEESTKSDVTTQLCFNPGYPAEHTLKQVEGFGLELPESNDIDIAVSVLIKDPRAKGLNPDRESSSMRKIRSTFMEYIYGESTQCQSP